MESDSRPSHYTSYGSTIKEQVFDLLDNNPLLLPLKICEILDLDVKNQVQYVRNLRSEWKNNTRFRQGLGCPDSQHGCHGWAVVPERVAVEAALRVGWVKTRAKNGMVIWKSELGRLEWFPTIMRVNVWVRSPANKGKALQLLCHAFSWNGLISDIKTLEKFMASFRWGAVMIFLKQGRCCLGGL